MDLPAELQAAPPRPAAMAARFLDQNRKKIRGTLVALAVLPAFLLFMGMVVPRLTGWRIKGLDGTSSIYIAVGLDLLLALFALAFYAQVQRSQKLFCEGIVTLGTMVKANAPGADGREAAYFLLEVEYSDQAGRKYAGKATTTGTKMTASLGSQVPLLYLPDEPEKFSIYDAELGMIPGFAKAVS